MGSGGLALALGLSLGAIAPGVSAAPDDPDSKPRAERSSSVTMDEILVRVRKREEPSQTVPVSFSAVSRVQLDQLGTRDLRDIEGQSPDLVVIPANATPGGGGFAIRGVGVLDIERTFDPAVGIFLDGVYISTIPESLLNTFDVEQIEIVRGPQSTLFGKNTIGGAILVTRTRPTGDYGFRGKVTLGSHGRNDYGGVLNFPIVDERLAGKLTVFRNNDEGAFKNSFNGSRVGGDRFLSIGGDLLFTPTESLEFLLKYETSEDRRDSGPFVNIAGPGEATCAVLGFCGEPANLERPNFDFSSATDYDLNALTLETNLELPTGLLTAVTAYRATDERTALDIDGVPAQVFSTIRGQTARQFSQELRYTLQNTGPLTVVTGLYYLENQYGLEGEVLFLPQFLNNNAAAIQAALGPNAPANQFPPGTTSALFRAEQDSYSAAAFAQLDYDLTDDLTLGVGARYTAEKKDFKSVAGIVLPPLGEIFPNAPADSSKRFNEWTGKIGLDYTLDEDALLYVFYSKGFRSGGFNGRNANPQDIGPYDAEKLFSWEAGAKTTWFDDRLTLNGAIFTNDYKDKQEQAIRGDPSGQLGTITVVDNNADVDIWGWELESVALPFEGLRLSGKLAYLDAEYDNYFADLDGPDANGMIVPVDNSDLDVRLSPEWQWSIGASYEFAVGPGLLTLSGLYRYVDNFQTEARGDPRGELDDVGYTDAAIAYAFETSRTRYTVRLFGKNLQDIVARNAAVIIPGSFAFSEVDEGATYGVTVEMDWR